LGSSVRLATACAPGTPPRSPCSRFAGLLGELAGNLRARFKLFPISKDASWRLVRSSTRRLTGSHGTARMPLPGAIGIPVVSAMKRPYRVQRQKKSARIRLAVMDMWKSTSSMSCGIWVKLWIITRSVARLHQNRFWGHPDQVVRARTLSAHVLNAAPKLSILSLA